MNSFTRHIFVAFLALIFAFGGVFLLNRGPFFASFFSDVPVDMTQDFSLLVRYSEESGDRTTKDLFWDKDYLLTNDRTDEDLAVFFPDRFHVRLQPESRFVIRYDSREKKWILRLDSGKLWMDSRFSSSSLILTSHDISSSSEPFSGSVFAFSASPDQVSLISFAGTASIVSPSGGRFSVPASRAATFENSNPVGTFSFEDLRPVDVSSNPWFQQNMKLDEQTRALLVQEYLDGISSRGVLFSSLDTWLYELRSGTSDFSSRLILDQDKRFLHRAEFLMDGLDDGLYFLRISDRSSANARFDLFRQAVRDFTQQTGRGDLIHDLLRQRFLAAEVLLPQDSTFYEIKRVVREFFLDFSFGSDAFLHDFTLVNRTNLFDAQNAISFDRFAAQNLVRSYFTQVARVTLPANLILEEYDTLGHVLLQEPSFFKDIFFSGLRLLSDRLLQEKRDDIVFDMHELLTKRLRAFLFTDKVSVEDARKTAIYLSFPGRFDQDDFFDYLESEYSGSALYGDLQKDRFTHYQKSLADRAAVSEIRSGIDLSLNAKNNQKVHDIIQSVARDFSAIGATKISVGQLVDIEQQYIPIESATLQGVVFSAIYDRDHQLVSQIQVNGQSILESALLLKKLPTLLKPKSESEKQVSSSFSTDFALEDRPDAGDLVSSNISEKVAKLLLSERFKSFSLTVNPQQIQTINFGRRQFRVFGALLPHRKEVLTVNFRFDMNTNMASEIVVKTLQGPQTLPDKSISLEEFPSKIPAFYDALFYQEIEKQTGPIPVKSENVPVKK